MVRLELDSTNRRIQKKTLSQYLSRRRWLANQNLNVAQLARNHGPFLWRLDLMKNLRVHDGCVNTICWNKTGEYILSGSDDCNLCITKPNYLFDDSKDYTVLHKVRTHHLGNIFSAQFIPNSGDTKIVSCSSQGPVILHDIYAPDPGEGLLRFNCHSSTICKVVTVPDNDNIFLSCSEDKTIRLFDMRVHTSCSRAGTCPHPALIRNSHSVTTLNLHPLNSNLMLVGRADGLGLVYDRRRLPDVARFSRSAAHAERLAGESSLANTFKYRHPMEGVVAQFQVPDMDTNYYQFTSLCYNHNGTQVLASYLGEYLYLFNHDTSSNNELISTLPRKGPPPDKKNDVSPGNANDGSTTRTDETKEGGPIRARLRATAAGPARISRIRVRGDWSDTGVNSMPHSRMHRNEAESDSSSSTSAFIELTVIDDRVCTRRSNRRRENDNDEGDDDDDDDDEEVDTNSERDDDKRDDNHDDDDDDDNDDGAGGANDTEVEDSATTADNASSNEATRRRQRISSETRAKFKKTLEGLKDKYGQITTYKPCIKYQGHRNSRTSIKEATFWGDDYIMSGSDCGRIMVWEKNTAKLIMAFQGDERVVNCLEPNPHHYVLASSGIDYDIKLWSTQSLKEGPLLNTEKEMNRIVENNEIMLEESKHTFSVPPHLFFRMLATLARS